MAVARIMLTTTDIIFLIALAIAGARGHSRGLLQALIGPCAFLLSCAIAAFWFSRTQKTFDSLIILVMAPPVLGWTARWWLRQKNHGITRPPYNTLDRMAGSAISMIWSGSIALVILASLIILPLDSFGLGDITLNVRTSLTFALFKNPMKIFHIIPPEEIKDCLDGLCRMPEKDKTALAKDQDIQALVNDPRLSRLLLDPAIEKAIEEKNFTALLANPQILEIAQDPILVSKILKAYPKIRDAQKISLKSP
ncbi:MAG: hypothetical protein WCI27_06025 [Candidatus Omnitrophota bacterium]